MARVIQDSGEAAIATTIGVDATGQAFNSIVAIEQYKGNEMNPLVNAGRDHDDEHGQGRASPSEVWNNIIDTYDAFAGPHARR